MCDNFEENEFPIFTNNLKVEINRKKVDEEFTVFQIGTSESFFKNNVLDISSEKFKAQSTAYYRNNRWFALFKKNSISLNEFKEEVLLKDESAIVNPVGLFGQDAGAKDGITDVELAQLLVNSLKNRNNELFAYNNITGSLYYSFDTKPGAKSFDFLKLRFFLPRQDSDTIALEAKTETFSEVSALKKYNKAKAEPNYVFDDETGEFRKRIHSDYGAHCRFFDKGALTRKGARRKFLDFSSNENFLKSKSGIIATFFEDVRENLSDYIEISQIPFTRYNSYDKPLDDYENKQYKSILQNRGVCVVDTVDTTESKWMRDKICNFLKEKYELQNISNCRELGKHIIEIIHDKESDFYASKGEFENPFLFEDMNKPQDQHNLYTEKDIIQHITVENSAAKVGDDTAIKDVMQNIVQELLIKGDLYDKHISLVNWNEPREWTFVRCGTGKWNNQKQCQNYIYYRMKLSCEGNITIDSMPSTVFPEGDWEIIDRIFRTYNHNNKVSPIDCIVYDNINNINVIYRTKQFTLPDVKSLSELIKLTDGKNTIDKNDLKAYIKEYRKTFSLTSSQVSAFDIINKNIENCSDREISFSKIREKTGNDGKKRFIKPKTISDFIQWLREKTDKEGHPVLLHGQFKSRDNLCRHFNSLLGVKSTELDGSFKYFVGKKKEALQTSLNCSCVIRDVIPWNQDGENPGGKILFDELAHMLTVEFVRNGQYTVLPFPVKYLNEYIRFCEKDDSFEEDS